MFKKFIPPLLAEKDMAAATATVAPDATRVKAPLPQASQPQRSAPLPTQPRDNCDVATELALSRLSQLSQV